MRGNRVRTVDKGPNLETGLKRLPGFLINSGLGEVICQGSSDLAAAHECTYGREEQPWFGLHQPKIARASWVASCAATRPEGLMRAIFDARIEPLGSTRPRSLMGLGGLRSSRANDRKGSSRPEGSSARAHAYAYVRSGLPFVDGPNITCVCRHACRRTQSEAGARFACPCATHRIGLDSAWLELIPFGAESSPDRTPDSIHWRWISTSKLGTKPSLKCRRFEASRRLTCTRHTR